MLVFSTLLLVASQVTSSSTCESYAGQTITPLSFDQVLHSLPTIAPKGAYETTGEYQVRVAAASTSAGVPVFVAQSLDRTALTYNADRQELTIWDRALGVGATNFSHVFGYGAGRPPKDNFSSAVGFIVNERVTGSETVEATNGFGAKFEIVRTNRTLSTVWEGAGRLGQSPFLGIKPFGPLTKLNVPAATAKDFIEQGSAALLVVPKAPYTASGKSVLNATFSRPRERVDTIDVIVADVKCAVLLDSKSKVLVSFTVR